jgi:hypothetical protein
MFFCHKIKTEQIGSRENASELYSEDVLFEPRRYTGHKYCGLWWFYSVPTGKFRDSALNTGCQNPGCQVVRAAKFFYRGA